MELLIEERENEIDEFMDALKVLEDRLIAGIGADNKFLAFLLKVYKKKVKKRKRGANVDGNRFTLNRP